MFVGVQTYVEVRQWNQKYIYIVANPSEEQENRVCLHWYLWIYVHWLITWFFYIYIF